PLLPPPPSRGLDPGKLPDEGAGASGVGANGPWSRSLTSWKGSAISLAALTNVVQPPSWVCGVFSCSEDAADRVAEKTRSPAAPSSARLASVWIISMRLGSVYSSGVPSSPSGGGKQGKPQNARADT